MRKKLKKLKRRYEKTRGLIKALLKDVEGINEKIKDYGNIRKI